MTTTFTLVIKGQIDGLKQELQQVRNHSLQAVRKGDIRKVAELTGKAASINKAIFDAESVVLSRGVPSR